VSYYAWAALIVVGLSFGWLLYACVTAPLGQADWE
jgi:hypothetical protein